MLKYFKFKNNFSKYCIIFQNGSDEPSTVLRLLKQNHPLSINFGLKNDTKYYLRGLKDLVELSNIIMPVRLAKLVKLPLMRSISEL